jgi:hypothetical protein
LIEIQMGMVEEEKEADLAYKQKSLREELKAYGQS